MGIILSQDGQNGLHVRVMDYVNKVSIDWLRFSFLPASWPFVRALFDVPVDVDNWTDGNKYRKKFFTMPLEGVTVAADSMPSDKGFILEGDSRIIVDFSGNGLAHYYERFKKYGSIYDLVSMSLAQPGARVLRLDVAFDDYEGLLSIDRIERMWLKDDNIITRWKSGVSYKKYERGGCSGGYTFYMGSRESESFARVYDKRLQEMSRGAESDNLPVSWVRFELEFKGDRATSVAIQACGSYFSSAFFSGVLRSQIDFKEGQQAAKKSDRKVARWWSQFLHGVDIRPVQVPKPVDSIVRKKEWLEKSVAPTLALMAQHYDGDVSWVYKLLESGERRLTPQQKALLETVTHGS